MRGQVLIIRLITAIGAVLLFLKSLAYFRENNVSQATELLIYTGMCVTAFLFTIYMEKKGVN